MLCLKTRAFCSSVSGIVALGFLAGFASAAAPDTKGKVVLANLDRYELSVRFGANRRDIKPNKASILKPKSYPVTIEYWSGNTQGGWMKQTVPAEGVYGFNFKRGKWEVTPLKPGKTTRGAGTTAKAPTQTQPGRSVVKNQNVVRQSAGRGAVTRRPARRLPMRGPINADRRRWSPLARVAWAASSLYQFVRDEQDRDLLRRLLIERRADDIKDFERWLNDSDLIEIAHKEEIKEAFDDLADLTDEEWNEVDTSDVKDWENAKAEVGDLISDSDWNNMTGDLSEVDSSDFWQEDVEVDLDQLEFAGSLDVDGDGDIDIGGGADLTENIDIGDVGISADNYDLGQFDDFGGGVIGQPGIGNLAGDVGQAVGEPVIGEPVGGVIGGDFGGGDFGGGYIPDNDMGDFGGGGDFDFGGGDFGGGDFDF